MATPVVLGLAVGVGWWASPEIVYYAVPAGAWLVWCALRRSSSRQGAVLAGAVTVVAAVIAALQSNRDRILAELVEFASIPSVSTDPGGCRAISARIRSSNTSISLLLQWLKSVT